MGNWLASPCVGCCVHQLQLQLASSACITNSFSVHIWTNFMLVVQRLCALLGSCYSCCEWQGLSIIAKHVYHYYMHRAVCNTIRQFSMTCV